MVMRAGIFMVGFPSVSAYEMNLRLSLGCCCRRLGERLGDLVVDLLGERDVDVLI